MEKIPRFAQPKHCLDICGRGRSDPLYDPTSLLVPENEVSRFTATKKQYWSIKSIHFDKIIFFKLGKFYELFYEDALIGVRLLDLQFTSKQLHCGFPEKSLEKYAGILV